MILERVEAWNVCQYEHVVLDFEFGITGITGRNGIGKTNLIDTSLFFGLTGKIIRSDINKEDLLRWGTAAGEVQVTFSHDSKNYQLTRRVHTSFVGLDDVDDPTWKLRGAEASKFMEDALGVDFKVFHNACWTSQGALTDIIRMTHSQRMTFFQKLTDVIRAERLRDLITQFGLAKLPIIEDRSEAILLKEGEQSAAVKAVSESKAVVDLAKVEEAEHLEKYNEVAPLKHLRRATEVAQDIRSAEQKLEQRLRAEAEAGKVLTDAGGELEEPEALTDAEQKALTVDLEAVDREATYLEQMLDEHLALSKDVEDVSKRAEAAAEILNDLRTKKVEAGIRIRSKKEHLSFQQQKICPTCGAALEMTDEQLEELAQAVAVEEAEYLELSGKVTAQDAQVKALFAEQKEKAGQAQKLSARISQGESYVERESALLGDFDLAELRERSTRIAEAAKRRNLLRELKGALEAAKDAVSEASREVASLKALPTVSEAQLAELTALGTAAQAASRAVRDAELLQRDAEVTLRHIRQELDTMRAHQVRYLATAKKRKLLEEAHSVLHRDNLPKIVMSSILSALNLQIGLYLSEFDTVFSARVTENFDLVCTFPDRDDVPAALLSGGQSVALALAFKFAVATLFSSSMPLMVLDEPTVYLDVDNVRNVARLLERIRDIAAKGTFILVATHDEALYPAMSRCVDLGEIVT